MGSTWGVRARREARTMCSTPKTTRCAEGSRRIRPRRRKESTALATSARPVPEAVTTCSIVQGTSQSASRRSRVRRAGERSSRASSRASVTQSAPGPASAGPAATWGSARASLVISAGEQSGSQEAAASRARGRPSRRAHSSSSVPTLPGSRRKSGCRSVIRSTSTRSAGSARAPCRPSTEVRVGVGSGRRATRKSAGRGPGTREVSSTRRLRQSARRASRVSRATSPGRCRRRRAGPAGRR